jgi:hypothetical protein
MVVNFRARGISRGARKLARTLMLIIIIKKDKIKKEMGTILCLVMKYKIEEILTRLDPIKNLGQLVKKHR